MRKGAGSEPRARGMALKAAIDGAHAAKSSRVGRNTAEPSSPANKLFCRPRSSDEGSVTPSVTTPCTDEGRGVRKGETSITMPVPKLPSLRQLCIWKARIGHAWAAVSGHDDNKEYGWCMENKSKEFEELAINNRERRVALLEAPLALAVNNTCPPVLQKRITEKETKYADAGEYMLLTSRYTATMIDDYYKPDRTNSSFTTFADLYVLSWA